MKEEVVMDNDIEQKMLGVCQAISQEDIERMRGEYDAAPNPDRTLHAICSMVFRKMRIRSIGELIDAEDEDTRQKAYDIMGDIYMLQSYAITKNKKQTKKIIHKKGDFKHNEDGSPILKPNGNNEEYDKDTVEYVEETVQVPYYDYTMSSMAKRELDAFLKNETVLPDFSLIEAKMNPVEDFARGLALIRELTKYYVFDNPSKFVERFALLICNAKAKGLNKKPKWPVLFSLVGDMGLGKGWFRDMVTSTYDEVFECRSQPGSFKALLATEFNSIMLTRGFVKLDEKNGLDSKQCETLKSLITEPTILVNRKHKDVKGVENLVTFFSCANESIKDVMGLQKDRRIVEFNVVGRIKEIPEDKMRNLLVELWKTMPCKCPIEDKIKDELIEESSEQLDTRMYEIVTDMFTKHQDEFVKGRYINTHGMKETVKSFGGVRYAPIVDWCLDKGVLKKQANGSFTLSKKELDRVIAKQRANESVGYESQQEKVQEVEEAMFPDPSIRKTNTTLKELEALLKAEVK